VGRARQFPLRSGFVALAAVVFSSSPSSACNTVVQCAPDTTFICKSGSEMDVRIYVSLALKRIYVRSVKMYDADEAEDVEVTDRFLEGSPPFATLKLTPRMRKHFRVARFYPVQAILHLQTSGFSTGAKVLCQTQSGRHLD
jgi:hypothetical protein